MAAREAVVSDAGWRLGHCNLGLNLDPKTVRVRVRVRVRRS